MKTSNLSLRHPMSRFAQYTNQVLGCRNDREGEDNTDKIY